MLFYAQKMPESGFTKHPYHMPASVWSQEPMLFLSADWRAWLQPS